MKTWLFPMASVVALGLGLRFLAKRKTPQGAAPGLSPDQAPPPKAPPRAPTEQPRPAAAGGVYRSPGGTVSARGWVALPGSAGREVTAEPLHDTSGATRYARLGYRAASELATSLGARLPTEAEAKALHQGGALLEPCMLPGAAMAELAELHRAKGWAAPKAGDVRMGTLEWAQAHDRCVGAQVDRLPEGVAAANAGKMWLKGAAPGKAINFGWLQGGRYVQNPGQAHDDQHTDYSQLITLVREVSP